MLTVDCFRHSIRKNAKKDTRVCGKIVFSLEFLPQAVADKCKVGRGR
jgi:hypothetical protein